MNFQRIGVLTILAVYLLIFVGSVVRSTGSGMGCPDWPKCFGSWVPPTNIDQLPLNYQEIYGAKLKGEVIFNPIKTWIEYLNRLLGATIGLLIFGTFLFSLKYWKSNKSITIFSGLALLLTGFQGWIGSKVVSTELAKSMISFHMLIAILIVFTLIYALVQSSSFGGIDKEYLVTKKYKLIWAVFLVTIIQVIFGVQVRERIDEVSKLLGESLRNSWVGQIGLKFYLHRSFSIIVVLLHCYFFFIIKKSFDKIDYVLLSNKLLLLVIAIEILTGVTLSYFGFPAYIQPIHLTLAILSLGIQSFLIFVFYKKTILLSENI